MTSHLPRAAWLTLALWVGCDVGLAPVVYGDPTVSDTPTMTLSVLTPAPHATLLTPSVVVTVSASAPAGVTSVLLALDEASATPCTPGEGATWTCTAQLLTGTNDVALTVSDGEGRVGTWDTRYTYAGDAPSLRLSTPSPGQAIAAGPLEVVGEARAGVSPTAEMTLTALPGGSPTAATLTDDGHFAATLVWPEGPATTGSLLASVTDIEGRVTTVTVPLVVDGTPPSLALTSPTEGAVFGDPIVTVIGVAEDALGIARVEVRVDAASWVTATGVTPFSVDVNLAQGPNRVEVRAVDEAGLVTETAVSVFRARTVTLDAVALGSEGGDLTLTLNRAALNALIPPEAAKGLVLLYLDIRGLLLEGMKAVVDAETYGLDTSTWSTAAWNLARIVTMTPDTVDVSQTSMAPMLTLGGALGLPVPTLLAEMGGIGVTETFLGVEEMADAIYRNAVATHPSMVLDPDDGIYKVPVTLHDAFQDLASLHETLGPSGTHPGFLSQSSSAVVLLPNFALTATGRSNLVAFDGIDLSTGKAYLFSKPADVGVVTFDFLDPEAFTVVGLASEPEVDLSIRIVEHDGFIAPGSIQEAGFVDGTPRGNSAVWGLPPWTFEYLVADALFESTRGRYAATGGQHTWSYDVGSTEDACVIDWDAGWITITTAAGIGDPPPPAYWWDMVNEMAQVRLHDGGLAEGEADLDMTLTGVRVPLGAEELIAATRPVLEAQDTALSEALIGDHSGYDSPCDLFLVKGNDDALYLFFVTPSDVPGDPSLHPQPALYADPGLSTRVSTGADGGSGDASHEKLKLSDAGALVYAADRDGSVWRLDIGAPEGDRVKVVLTPAQGTP